MAFDARVHLRIDVSQVWNAAAVEKNNLTQSISPSAGISRARTSDVIVRRIQHGRASLTQTARLPSGFMRPFEKSRGDWWLTLKKQDGTDFVPRACS
jgi:hypothetical protein